MARKVDPKEQFSKKLAGRTEWFWFFYMVILVVAMVLAPATALPMVYMGVLATFVMIVSVISYKQNSVTEKSLYWGVKLAEALAGKKTGDESENSEESEPDEGDGNG